MTRVKRFLGLVVSWLVVVAGLASITALTAEAHPVGTFVPVQPVRVLDTRNALGVATTSAIAAGGTVNVKIAGANGLPSGISAIVANVTVVAPQAAGHVTAWPGGSAMPTASNLNYVAGQTVPNQIVVGVGADGSVNLFIHAQGHLLLDVTGYFPAGASANLTPQVPSRLLDTRFGVGTSGTGAVPANGVVRVHVPANAQGLYPAAVALNLTSVAPAAAGFLTAFPCDTDRPNASNLNYVAGQTVAGLAVSKVSASGTVCIFTPAATHIIADLSAIAPIGSDYHGLAPVRQLDTRSNTSVPAGGTISLDVLGAANGVPTSQVTAVMVNVTVVNQAGAGHIAVWPSGSTMPTTSVVNYTPGAPVANSVLVKVGSDGKINLYSHAKTDLIVDILGYVSGEPAANPMVWKYTDHVPAQGYLNDMACPTSTWCEAVDNYGNYVTWNGTTWSAPTRIAPEAVALWEVGCVSPTFCVRVGTDGIAYINNNGTESTKTLKAGGVSYSANASCSANGICMVTADEKTWYYQGGTWTDISRPDLWAYDVSCAGNSCMATDYESYAIQYISGGWGGWTLFNSTPTPFLISCPTQNYCLAVNRAGAAVEFDTGTWYDTNSVGATVTALSCGTSNLCTALTNGGASRMDYSPASYQWSSGPIQWSGTDPKPYYVTARPDNNAFFYGTGDVVYNSSGASKTYPDPYLSFSDVSCVPGTASCIGTVQGLAAKIVTGAIASKATVTSGKPNQLVDVSCPAKTFCAAVSAEGKTYVSADMTTWSAGTSLGLGVAASNVSCPTAGYCMVGMADGRVIQTTGSATGAPITLGSAGVAVSCSANSFCLAASGTAFSKWNGTSWTSVSASAAETVNGISCSAATSCVAVSTTGKFGTFNGTSVTWLTYEAADITSVSCPTAAICFAAATNGDLIQWDGTKWTVSATIPGVAWEISCPTADYCTVVTRQGTVWTGSTWNGSTTVTPPLPAAKAADTTGSATAVAPSSITDQTQPTVPGVTKHAGKASVASSR